MFDWITGIINAIGPVGVALLMFLENVFPPIPSELIMPLAGFTAAQGSTSLVVMIIAGSAGTLAGALLWYWIGLRIGADRIKRLARRHGRWLAVSPDDIDRATGWFKRHDRGAIFTGRLVPTVRTFISVPAGIEQMSMGRFLLFSTAGTVIWNTALAVAGYVLQSQYDKVADWLNPISTGVVVVLVLLYLWRVITYRRRVPLERESTAGE